MRLGNLWRSAFRLPADSWEWPKRPPPQIQGVGWKVVLVDGAAYERAMEMVRSQSARVMEALVEIDRLRGERDRAFMFADELQKENERLRALAHDLADEVRMLRATLIRMAKAAGPAWTPPWGDAGAPLDDVLARYREVSGERDADADHA